MNTINGIFLVAFLMCSNFAYGWGGAREKLQRPVANVENVEIAQLAQNFSLDDMHGKKVSLEDFRGKFVILEWSNDECPFVKKHYEGQNMQNLQKTMRKEDVIWLKIISSNIGRQGHLTPDEAIVKERQQGSYATHLLLDPKGEVGRAYHALVTPHMFIINKEGKLAYDGAIDSISSTDLYDISKAENYIKSAMHSLLAGNEVKVKKTRPYGCSIKY